VLHITSLFTVDYELITVQRVDRTKLVKERLKQLNQTTDVPTPTRLPDRVHTQHRTTEINRPEPNLRNERTDGRSTRHVVSHVVFLKRYARQLSDSAQCESRLRSTGIPLLGVRLDCWSSVHCWSVVVFVLLSERRVQGVSHVAAQEEALGESTLRRVV
jgi:hypothetical protein